jgi:peptide chain release factor subunit 1
MITSETVQRIIRLDGGGLPIVSLYVRVPADYGERDRLHSYVNSLLADVREMAHDKSIDRDARLSLRGDLERIEQTFQEEEPPAGAVALFSCSRRDIYEVVNLPRPVRERAVVDETPFVRPMLAVLDEYRRCCVVVVDEAFTQLWELYQDELEELRRFRDPALRKPDFAYGFKEFTIHNRVRELAKRHYRNTVTMLEGLFRGNAFDVIAVGGHDYETQPFLESLPQRLRERVAGTFVIDAKTATRNDIKQQAGEVLERYEREEERRLVEQTLERAAAGGWAAVGLSDCLWAGSVAAIEKLLVQEDAIVPGVVCDESGWLGTAGETCPLCGKPLRQTPDILDELAQTVIDESGSIEHVEADTQLKALLAAAELRFPLPPKPGGQPAD